MVRSGLTFILQEMFYVVAESSGNNEDNDSFKFPMSREHCPSLVSIYQHEKNLCAQSSPKLNQHILQLGNH